MRHWSVMLNTLQVGPPIPTTFGNTGILVLEKTTTGIPVLIPVFCSISKKAALAGAAVKTSQLGVRPSSEMVWVAGRA